MWGYPCVVETLYSLHCPAELLMRVQRAIDPEKKGLWQWQSKSFQGSVSTDSFNITRQPFSNKFLPPQITGVVRLAPDSLGSQITLQHKVAWETAVGTGIAGWFMMLFIARFVIFPEVWNNEPIRFTILIMSAVASLFVLVCSFWFDVWLSRRKLIGLLELVEIAPV